MFQPRHLEVARANARQHGVEDRIEFVQEDFNEYFSIESGKDTQFDLIISNPPYIPTDQLSQLPRDVQKEPAMALDGGEDGLNFYRIIIKYTPYLLRERRLSYDGVWRRTSRSHQKAYWKSEYFFRYRDYSRFGRTGQDYQGCCIRRVFMEKFIIEGGKPLKGEIKVSGSKNATLPILAATLAD